LRKRAILGFFLLVFLALTGFASIEVICSKAEVIINDISYKIFLEEQYTIKLIKGLELEDYNKYFNFRPWENSLGNNLEASLKAEELNSEFIIYSTILDLDWGYDLKVFVYKRANKSGELVFREQFTKGKEAEVFRQASKAIYPFLLKAEGINPKVRVKDFEDYQFGLTFTPGAAFFLGDWTLNYFIIFVADISFYNYLLKNGLLFKDFDDALSFGFQLGYELAKNNPEVEACYLHSLSLLFPFEYSLGLNRENRLQFFIAPAFKFIIKVPTSGVRGKMTSLETAIGGWLGLGYNYWLDVLDLSIGLNTGVAAFLTQKVEFIYFIKLGVVYYLKGPEEL